MSEPVARDPYDHALYLINEANRNIAGTTTLPDGRPRSIDSTALSGALGASSNLAIASALLAVADALRGLAPTNPEA